MEFQSGNFQQFKAITKLHLGGTNPPMDIMPGMVIEYDGSSTKISGQLYNVPSIAGAVRVGWLIPINEPMTNYVPQPAGVQVRPAKSASSERGSPMILERAVDDERSVGTLGESNARRADVQANQFGNRQASQAQVSASGTIRTAEQSSEPKKYQVFHEDPPVEISYPLGQADHNRPLDPRTIKADDSHNEGARPVAQLRSAKMGSVNVDDTRAFQDEMRKLDPVTGVRAPIAKVASAPVSRTNQDAVGGVPMNQTFANGATGDVAYAVSGDDLEDILKDAVSTGRPAPGPLMGSDDQVGTLKPRYVPKTIEWDKSIHWRSRVKLAIETYSDDPDALQYVLSVEDPAVVKFIEDGLAKLG